MEKKTRYGVSMEMGYERRSEEGNGRQRREMGGEGAGGGERKWVTGNENRQNLK